MTLRASSAFIAISIFLAAFLGLGSWGLALYALLAEPKIAVMVVPLAFGALPFVVHFLRPVPQLRGAVVEMDEHSIRSRSIRIPWTEVARVTHGPFDQDTWIFEASDGRRVTVGTYWYGGKTEPIQYALQHALPYVKTNESVIVKTATTTARMALWSSIGLGCAFLLPLGRSLATIPAEFIPLPARIVTGLLILLAVVATIRGLYQVLTGRVTVTKEHLVIRGKTLPLHEATEIEISDTPKRQTTVRFKDQTVVLDERQDGYFEARELLSRAAAR